MIKVIIVEVSGFFEISNIYSDELFYRGVGVGVAEQRLLPKPKMKMKQRSPEPPAG